MVAYAISGTIDINLKTEPIGFDPNNNPVYLKDIWPDSEDIRHIIENTIDPMLYEKKYSQISHGSTLWEELIVPTGKLYEWEPTSTYIQEPPFFMDFPVVPPEKGDISGARVLAYLGNSITTDHISPAGEFSEDSLAGQYLISKGLSPENFNSYGSRRGNHEVMMRGTFANIDLKNRLVPEKEGGWTRYFPSGKEMTIYEAAMLYKQKRTPLIIIAGKEYGTGSSRDWAAKGTYLLGVEAVMAESFERIHRSNLLGMGVLPLQFKKGENADTLGLRGDEVFDISRIGSLKPGEELRVVAKADDKETSFNVISRLDAPIEVEFYKNGGILHTFLRNILKK